MGVYNNNKDGTRSTLANTIQVVDAPMEQFVSRGEFSAVTPSDVSADNKLVAENEVTKAVDTMPTASADLVGTIVQYVGTTTANYTNGYFYKCVSDGAVTPTYSWVEVISGGGGGSPEFVGTMAEWNALTTEQKNQYDIVNILEDGQIFNISIPKGGITGQILTKKSNTDYDTEWKDASGGVTPQEVEEIVNGYPSYVDTEKKAVLSRLWTTYASVHNPVVVGFNTDQHLHNNVAVERVAILTGLHALRDMTKEFPFNVCVLGGDACGNSTIQAICNEVNDVTNALDGANCPVIHINGNHDSWGNNNNMIKGQLFSALATSTFKNKAVTTTDNTNNCYYDDEVNQIRYIFLNDSSMRGYDLNKINVRDFMVNALETLPNFFAAIIFSHHPLGNLTDTPHIRVDDWNEPLNFGDYVAPYKDRIIVCICGHIHADKSEVKDGILYLSTTCAGRTELNDGSTRTDGQADVTAQDVMVIDREHYVIHCIRYGNGNDRNITYYVPTYTNVLASAIDTDGTVFNGVGYQEGKRLNSSGGTTDYDISDVSGYIPVNANDVIRIRGAFMSNKKDTIINYINFYNSDFSFKSGKQAFNWWLGKDTTTSTHDIKEMTANNGNVVEFKVPENADFDGNYMRISCELLSQAVITINEDIPLK